MEKTAINQAGKLADNLMILTYLQQLIENLEFMPEEDVERVFMKITALSFTGEA